MTIRSHYEAESRTMNIEVNGRFDFKMVNAFKESYGNHSEPVDNIVVDFRETEYMDSSGLGMLLNLKRQANEDTVITLTNCRPQIKKILMISRFDKKFTIQ